MSALKARAPREPLRPLRRTRRRAGLPIGAALLLAAAAATAQFGPRPPGGMGGQAGQRPPELLAPDRVRDTVVLVASDAVKRPLEVGLWVPGRCRYPGGAPVAVIVKPAFRPDPLLREDRIGLTAAGFLVVVFSYPEESFDQGGPVTHREIADVLLYALGLRKDTAGKTIQEGAGIPVRTDLVGVIGWSHGGNAAITTLAAFPSELASLAFYVSYESPCGTSAQRLGDSILMDYGGRPLDPDPRRDADGDGDGGNEGKNPYVNAGLNVDWSLLAWDAAAAWPCVGNPEARGVLYLDGNRNGRFDAQRAGEPGMGMGSEGRPGGPGGGRPRGGPMGGGPGGGMGIPPGGGRGARPGTPQGEGPGGQLTCDANRNGRLDRGEDFPFHALEAEILGQRKRVYSLPVITAATAGPFRAAPHPADVADVDATRRFWSERDMAASLDGRRNTFSNLLCYICAGREDHVQVADGSPHAVAQYEGLMRMGAPWVGVNPDPVYVRAFLGDLPAGFPQERLNGPVTRDNASRWRLPTGGPKTQVMVTVAATELADRVAATNRSGISGVLFPVSLPSPVLWPPDPGFIPGSAAPSAPPSRGMAVEAAVPHPDASAGGPEWEEPVNVRSVNTAADEKAPCLSPDGLELYFTRIGPPATGGGPGMERGGAPGGGRGGPGAGGPGGDRPSGGMGGRMHASIWTSRWTGEGWGSPVELDRNVNFCDEVADCSMTADGRSLVFHARRPGESEDLYVCERAENGWGPARKLGPEVNSEAGEMCPAISPDGNTLVFMRHGAAGGPGGEDLWVSRRVDGQWTRAVVLGREINSPGDDFCPALLSDGALLFASNDRHRAGLFWDIWRSVPASGTWAAADRLRPPVNTEFPDCCPCVSFDGRLLFFSSKRDGGAGSWDLWTTRTRGAAAKEPGTP